MNDLLSTTQVIDTTTIETRESPALNLVKRATRDVTTNAFQAVTYQFDAIGGADSMLVDAIGGADLTSFDLFAGPDALPFSTMSAINRATTDAVGGTDAMSFDVVGGRRLR
jgi:hypothetical protein